MAFGRPWVRSNRGPYARARACTLLRCSNHKVLLFFVAGRADGGGYAAPGGPLTRRSDLGSRLSLLGISASVSSLAALATILDPHTALHLAAVLMPVPMLFLFCFSLFFFLRFVGEKQTRLDRWIAEIDSRFLRSNGVCCTGKGRI